MTPRTHLPAGEPTRAARGSLALWLAGAGVLALVAALVAHGPLAQDPAYGRFADTTFLGVPHFWNVVTNLPFLVAGAAGLLVLRRRPAGVLPELRPAYGAFFAGGVLVCFGSAWYHLAPSDGALVQDRLPMTVAFMAFLAIVLGEHVSPALARRALWPLVAAGVGSVLWWTRTDDLRPYALVQFGPALVVPALLLARPSRLATTRPLWLVLASYAAAKLLELGDRWLHEAIGVAGHPLKHLAASGCVFAMVAAARRAPRPS